MPDSSKSSWSQSYAYPGMTQEKKVKEEGLWVERVDFQSSVLPKDGNVKQVVRYMSYRIQEEAFSVRYLFRSYMF